MKKFLSLSLSVLMLFCSSFCLFTTLVCKNNFIKTESRYATTVPYGGVIKNEITDTIYYSYKEDNEKYINPYKLPIYIASGIDNSCAITAGGAVIGHYDRLYEELIPNHTGITFMGQFVYGSHDDEVDVMHQELYKKMGTTSQGTTVEGYKSGMKTYVQSKGCNIEITGIYKNTSLNKSSYMSALESGKLLTVFMDGFSMISGKGIQTFDGYDTISQTVAEGLHTMTAYGYRNIKYYDSYKKLIQEDNYLLVHTGFASAGLGMIRLNKYITIDDGYIINIS